MTYIPSLFPDLRPRNQPKLLLLRLHISTQPLSHTFRTTDQNVAQIRMSFPFLFHSPSILTTTNHRTHHLPPTRPKPTKTPAPTILVETKTTTANPTNHTTSKVLPSNKATTPNNHSRVTVHRASRGCIISRDRRSREDQVRARPLEEGFVPRFWALSLVVVAWTFCFRMYWRGEGRGDGLRSAGVRSSW